MKNIGNYHKLYVRGDTLLLTDILDTKTPKLDPANFYETPRLIWMAALKMIKVQLELLTDTDMVIMIDKGIRGGICHPVHRYVRANNMHDKLQQK